MNKRPLAVTIISWLFIATGVIGLAHHLIEINSHQPFQFEIVWILILSLLAVVCGVFMLRGANWARWLALTWIGLHVLLSFFHSLQQVLMHGLLFVLIAYVLFRPEAKAYFHRSEANDV